MIVPETRAVEVYRLAGPSYVAVSADPEGRVHAATIHARFSTTHLGPRLRVHHAGELLEV